MKSVFSTLSLILLVIHLFKLNIDLFQETNQMRFRIVRLVTLLWYVILGQLEADHLYKVRYLLSDTMSCSVFVVHSLVFP